MSLRGSNRIFSKSAKAERTDSSNICKQGRSWSDNLLVGTGCASGRKPLAQTQREAGFPPCPRDCRLISNQMVTFQHQLIPRKGWTTPFCTTRLLRTCKDLRS